MADRSGKARAEAAELLDAQRAELDRLRGELATIRSVVWEERAAHDAVFDEIREASRVGRYVDAHDTDSWQRWRLSNRNLETLLARLAKEAETNGH